MRKITKLFTTQAKSINDETKTIRFKISDNQADRMGEIVDQESWDFKNYMNNPIVLWGHNPDEPENVLGQTLALETENGQTFAEMQFDDDINPKAALVWKQLLKGTLRTVSVGFIAHEQEGNVLKNNELLEVSVVPIPANPRAIALSMKDGSLSRKDAKFLQDSMKRELEYIEQQMQQEEDEEQREKAMTDEQFAKLMDAIGGIGERVGKLEEAQNAAKVEDTADDTEEDEQAAQTGSDDATGTSDDDDSAKGGDDDQSGAEETDIDLDAELTPELEAQLEEQLATADEAA